MGQAKIRKMRGEYPAIDNSREYLAYQSNLQVNNQGHSESNEDKNLAQERRKPLPFNNSCYHFPVKSGISTGNEHCLFFCADYFDGNYNDYLEETAGIGEMAAHMIMSGRHVIFASSIHGEASLHQIMIPSCKNTMSRFGILLPTPNDYEVKLSASNEDVNECAPSWTLRDSETGYSFMIKDNFGGIRGITYLVGVDVYGELESSNGRENYRELPHVKEAKSQVKMLGAECAKYGLGVMLAIHDSLLADCRDRWGSITPNRVSGVINMEWDGIGHWLK